MGVAGAVLNLIVEGCFGFETEPLKDANRFGPVGNHLRGQFFQADVLREVHDRFCRGSVCWSWVETLA